MLEELVDPSSDVVRVSPAFEDGPALLAAAQAQGLEGVVAKRADAPYRSGRRTPEWQKLKLRAQEDFPIVGFTRGTGKRAKLGALVLARRESDGLHWAGNVGSGEVKDFTALGDVVNTASRLQSHAKPGQIVMTERVYQEAAAERFPDAPMVQMDLKGKSEPVAGRIVELTAAVAA